MLLAHDQPHRLDRERGVGGVGRLQQNVPEASDRERPARVLEPILVKLVARLQLGMERWLRRVPDRAQDTFLVQPSTAVEGDADCGTGRDLHRDLDRVQQVVLVEQVVRPDGVQQR